MQKNKMHKIDLIFIGGIICIGLIGSLIDTLNNVNFPVYSVMSIYGSYVLWIILLIYSAIIYKKKNEKPEYVKWYWFFILPFFHMIFVIIGLLLFNIIGNIFNL